MIVGIEGNQGDGKTALMVWLILHYFGLNPEKNKIHCNFWLNIPGLNAHYVTSVHDIENIFKGYFFADEFWSWIDSRVSGYSDINAAVTGIIMKIRKRGYSLFFESKRMHMSDRRVRELVDYVLKPNMYYNNNGSLEIIQQNLLNPIDLEPYLNDLWVVAYQYKPIDEHHYQRMSNTQPIIFKLTEVCYLYDTHEEITSLITGERSPGIEKGIKIETKLEKHLKSLLPEDEIVHNHNSLGWDLRTSKYSFDCVSPTTRPHSSRPYLDIRNKRIEALIKDAQKESRSPYWAYHWLGYWHVMPMVEGHIGHSLLSTREAKRIEKVVR